MPQPPFDRTISEGSGEGAGLKVEGTNARPFGEDFLQDVISVSWGSLGFLVFSGTTAGLASQDGNNWVDVEFPIKAVCGAFGDARWIISGNEGRAVSKDAGKTWKSISAPNFFFLAYIKPDKKAKKGIFAGTDGEFPYTSVDSGATWQKGPDLSSSSSFFNVFSLFLAGGGSAFIMDGGADGVVEADPFFGGDVIPLPFPFPVYSGGWQSASAFSSVPWDELTTDPEGESCLIYSFTAAYDPDTEQYKLWAYALADGDAIMSTTSSSGTDWSGSKLEYTVGLTISGSGQSFSTGPVFTGTGAGGGGILLTTMVKGKFDDPENPSQGGELTSGVLIDGEFDGTPGESGPYHPADGGGLFAGGAAFNKNTNDGVGLFAVGFYTEDKDLKVLSAKVSVSAKGEAWTSTNISIKPQSIAVGNVSGFLAIGDPIG